MKKKILVVDDEENLRLLYGGEFEDEGYAVATAASAEEAFAVFKEFRPDLVTLDVKMPGMGGIAALRAIRDIDPAVPVVMLTAYPEFKADFDVLSADAYVVKSTDLEGLKRQVRFLLGGGKQGTHPS
ncbi:MAG: response regulator [Nitrospirae bacterium]|nr:response regulator [Nitrospirota bacterium]